MVGEGLDSFGRESTKPTPSRVALISTSGSYKKARCHMTDSVQFFSVRNFSAYQHYKDRHPPWIKLYNSLLDDFDFVKLPDSLKWPVVGCMLLASRTDNKIPMDLDYLKRALAVKSLNLQELTSLPFFVVHDASGVLAERLSREEKRREEKSVVFDFAELWKQYPNTLGRKAAEKHFQASVKTPELLAEIHTALANYKRHLESNPEKPVQNGSTWFNNWQDWKEWQSWMDGKRLAIPKDSVHNYL